MEIQNNSLEKLIEDTHKEIADRVNRGVPVLSNKEEDTFDGQNGQEPVAIDTAKALDLRSKGMTWNQVAEELGQSTHRVYSACRNLDIDRPKPKAKWEACFKEISVIDIGESATVRLPPGGTRAQMSSMLGVSNLTQKWRWSLQDNRDGTITATKVGTWSSVDAPEFRPKSKSKPVANDDNLKERTIAILEGKIRKLQEAIDILSDPELKF